MPITFSIEIFGKTLEGRTIDLKSRHEVYKSVTQQTLS